MKRTKNILGEGIGLMTASAVTGQLGAGLSGSSVVAGNVGKSLEIASIGLPLKASKSILKDLKKLK